MTTMTTKAALTGGDARVTLLGFMMFVAATLILVAANFLSGCAAFTPNMTCQAIDLASKTCPLVVDFIGQDGGKQSMQITNDDAVGLKHDKEEKAATAKRDGGAK